VGRVKYAGCEANLCCGEYGKKRKGIVCFGVFLHFGSRCGLKENHPSLLFHGTRRRKKVIQKYIIRYLLLAFYLFIFIIIIFAPVSICTRILLRKWKWHQMK
jgi:hypothetical protein